jgi:stage II sporulation protein M
MRYVWWVVIATALFGLGLVWGLSMPSGGGGTLSGELGALEELARFITSLPAWAMFLLILVKNVTAVLFSFVMSPLLLAVPLFALVLNGWVIGAVAGSVIAEESVGYLLRGLLPHGVLELPAFFLGQAAALSFGTAAMQAVFKEERRRQFMNVVRVNLRYLAFALALLVPAAAIEAFVTPLLLR